MKSFLQKLLKYVAYIVAALVIVLAVGVGLFRLFLPRLPEYQEEIKDWANSAIGLRVEFTGMDARWRLSGPELNFYNASLGMPGSETGVFAAEEISVGVGLMRLLLDRTLVVDRVGVRETEIVLSRSSDGKWLVQGIPFDKLAERYAATSGGRDIVVVAEDLTLDYQHPDGGPALSFGIDALQLSRSGPQFEAEAVVELPDSLGNRVLVTAGQRPGRSSGEPTWHFTAEGRALKLVGWSGLTPDGLPEVSGGTADLSLALDWSEQRVANATIDVDIEALQTAGMPAVVNAAGRVDYAHHDDGWLLAAENVRVRTDTGAWPETNLQVQAGTAPDGRLQSLSATASYLNLGDRGFAMPWLPDAWQEQLRRYDPSGTVSDLTLNLGELQSERVRFDVAMQLQGAGVTAGERWPGVRGFTGTLRANRSGGRLEVDATDLQVDLSRWLAEPVDLEHAEGTVIWRRNRNGTIVLSDSVTLQNADLTSRSSLQISLPADGGTPIVDAESHWSVSDLGKARRYLPVNQIKPKLYRWLNSALVAGRIPQGTARFSGPLDKFPFDNGEGVFRVEATLEDATLRYSDLWPDVENLNLDLIVDRTRLYSDSNTAINAGNSVVDAKIEIADLRAPVLTIDAFATGSMESIRRFARQSPIADVFGGHLQQVTVDGDASFNLNLRYPILNRDDYEFTTRIQASDASLRVQGLAPPVTELNGIVKVSRDNIETESLFGRFLGQPVTIDLLPAGDGLPSYSVIANLSGNATIEGVAEGFDVPLTRVLGGSTGYDAQLRFPRAGADDPMPMQIDIRSDLQGIDVSLPPPFAKTADQARPLSVTIEFPAASAIDVRGGLGDALKWTLGFRHRDAGWDFDRGVLAAGGAYPGAAETRGLHIVGQTPELRLRDWLALASGEASGVHLADRMRSMDLRVQNLYVMGQHFKEHRVIVDRSASVWLVQMEGEQADGTVTIPYDFGSGRALTVDMRTLILPGSDADAPQTAITTDPRTVPPLSIRAEEFALGSRHLGRIEAVFEKTPDGLRAERIRTVDESYTIDGKAGWEVDTREPSGQRTWVEATLRSNDVERTMQRLNSKPGIDGEDMEIHFDVRWSGGPREDFLSSLDGDFIVRFGTGQLDEVEPGAGRMFGLMSVVALPRRLALDFRDVLDKGFVFDEITGTFRVDDGNAYTCDLSLKGPAADVGIVGRAGLVAQDYDQSAMVSANVGNTLPVVGAVVAGPQVAAALLIFSQIFKKPLQEMGQVYYAIEGSWDQPEVDTANARRFAAASKLAGCLDDAR